MKLLSIKISNFKAIRDFVLDAGGESLTIFAENGVGKTTVADAYFFCLFGKDSRGQADFDIKTIGADGEPLHNLEHTVEVALDQVTLRRTYKEVYTKKRGAAVADFAGHTTDYYVDGVPVDKKAFDATVAGLYREEVFRLITDPNAFALLPWANRRKLLMTAFAGDVTDASVFSSDPSLSNLPAILSKHSVEDYRKVADAQRREINQQLTNIPARIDELTRNLQSSGSDAGTVGDVDIDSLRAELAAVQARRAELVAGGVAAKLASELAEIDAEILRYETQMRRAHEAANDGVLAARRKKEADLADARQRLLLLQRSLDADKLEHGRLDTQLKTLRTEYDTLAANQYSGSDMCPTCGQALPPERVAEARENFNADLAKRKDDVAARGKACRRQFEDLTAKIDAACEELMSAKAAADGLAEELITMAQPPAFVLDEEEPGYRELQDRRLLVVTKQTQLKVTSESAVAEVDELIRNLSARIAGAERAIGAKMQQGMVKQRIDALAAEEKGLTAKYEELMFNIGLVEKFIRAKVSMVTDRINGQFEMARFRLFEEQINGGLAECCEITYNGVPWGSLNTASRVNVGLDIIDTMVRALKVAPAPIFIDGAESVLNLRPTLGQQIRLVVNAGDKQLRVVPDGGSSVAAPVTTQKGLF